VSNIPIESINIDRDNRQRRELPEGPLRALMDSISKVGLINPVVLDEHNTLVAGERRLSACTRLGWTSIPYTRKEDCTPELLYLIELEENVRRSDLTWQEECKAISEFHRMCVTDDPSWTAAKTAEQLTITQAELSQRRAVQKALDEGNPLVVAADKYSVARGIVTRSNSRRDASEGELMDTMLQPDGDPLSDLEFINTEEPYTYEGEVDLPTKEKNLPFVHCEFDDWATDYSGKKFNFIHCDFPYGINAGKHNSGAAKHFGGYEDSEDVYWDLLYTLGLAMHNVVADSAHMMFWFSMDYYARTKEVLEAMGWSVSPFPLLWHKSDNSGILPDPKRGPRRIYETAFLCSRGDRFVVQSVANTISHPNTKAIHMSEKPQPMLAHFFRMFVDESTTMLDPTMGSGNAVLIAEAMGAKRFLGLERDEEFYHNACEAALQETV